MFDIRNRNDSYLLTFDVTCFSKRFVVTDDDVMVEIRKHKHVPCTRLVSYGYGRESVAIRLKYNRVFVRPTCLCSSGSSRRSYIVLVLIRA